MNFAGVRFASEEQVLSDREVRDERELLEYRGDSGRHRIARTVEIKDAVRGGFLDRRGMRRAARKVLEIVEVDLDPDLFCGDLIYDEPTAALDGPGCKSWNV